jgi:uncharacterized integral membrane protein
MILQPAVIALSVGSLIVTSMILYTTWYGVKILRHWDLRSGSELQLNLERQTYLVSTVMSYAFCFQLFSLFLFIFTADKLSSLFVGAMCAAGTLNVNGYGYPTLVFKITNFILGGVWLILNYTDNRAIDYPLIKKKYSLLLLIAPFMITELVLQGAYFLHLDAHVITSCCGSLFSPEGKGVGAVFTALPSVPMKVVFYTAMGLTWLSGFLFYRRGRPAAGFFFALMSLVTFVVSVAGLISFISLYFYQLPTHHCPFCILQGEYSYVGYPLYICLLGGVVGGVATGVLMAARNIPSLRKVLAKIQKRLTFVTILFYLLFTAIVTWTMVFTNFKLEGY